MPQHEVQFSFLVSATLLMMSLVVPMTRGQSSNVDECIKNCEAIQKLYDRINPSWPSMLNDCTNRCRKSGLPLLAQSEATTTRTTTTTPTTILSTTRTTTTTTPPTTTRTTTTTTPPTTTRTTTTTTVPTTTRTTTTRRPTTTSTTSTTTPSTSQPPTTTTQQGCGLQREGIQRHVKRQRIIGGYVAEECEYPWTVFISGSNNICAGAIIDEYNIITAAHCVRNRANGQPVDVATLQIRAGSSSIANATAYTVTTITIHPQYDSATKVYDVAVLTVATRFVFSQCVTPVCLPTAGSDPRDAVVCATAGWGITDPSIPLASPILRGVDLPIVNQTLCRNQYGAGKVNELTFCAGNYYRGGIDSCQGDSGAPLMCLVGDRYVVYGLVSNGYGCALPTYPGIYTNMAHWNILQFVLTVRKRS